MMGTTLSVRLAPRAARAMRVQRYSTERPTGSPLPPQAGTPVTPQAVPHRTAAQPTSKHRLLYSEIFPPLLRVLAYSTAAYFALHLTWGLLHRSEEGASQDAELTHLQRDIRAAAGTKEI